MPSRTLNTLLASTVVSIEDAVDLTARADVWHNELKHYPPARFRNAHFSQIAELAFLKAFLTWESFLEEAFVLYLLGKRAPSGFRPVKHVTPVDRDHALELLSAEVLHTDWTAADRVIRRANRCFKYGRPFVATIRPRIPLLNNLKTIRNALSHASAESQEKFKTFVRNELTYYPVGMTPGSFLMTTKAGVNPPTTYFSFYAGHLQAMVEAIVPE